MVDDVRLTLNSDATLNIGEENIVDQLPDENGSYKKIAYLQRVLINGEHAKTKFALRASEVIFDSEVHFVSEVSLCGEVKANLTSL